MKKDLQLIINQLREQGISREMCKEIEKNADAGAIEWAKQLICKGGASDEHLERVFE